MIDTKMAQAIEDLDLGIDLGAFGSVFNAIEIAEDEIDRAMRRHPEQQKAIWNSFKMLQRPPLLRDKPEELYRAYCRELLERVAKGKDLKPATEAEMLIGMSEASMAAPLNRAAAALYYDLFVSVFGDARATELGLDEGAEYMVAPEYAKDELFATLQKKARVRDRAIKPEDEWSDVPEHRLP